MAKMDPGRESQSHRTPYVYLVPAVGKGQPVDLIRLDRASATPDRWGAQLMTSTSCVVTVRGNPLSARTVGHSQSSGSLVVEAVHLRLQFFREALGERKLRVKGGERVVIGARKNGGRRQVSQDSSQPGR